MNYKNKGAFTFIEMIIAISIVVLLAVVGNSSLSTYKEKSNNSKVISDLSTLNNSLLSYSTENSKLPKAGGNNNYFKSDTSYAHSWTSTGTFGAHGFITENTLPNKYLNYLPLDPVTSQYYAYGRTKTDLQFEVAGVILKDSQPISLVNGNYTAETGPYNLIREYNGPDFVYDKSTSVFPYNPYEKILTAKINDFSGSVIDIKINNNSISTGELLSYTLRKGDNLNLGTGTTADIYFSDGTLSTLGDLTRASELIFSDMSFGGENNLITKIKLVLGVGTIWSQATSLGSDSSFEIYTTDSSAAVRGTVFGISKKTNTDIVVLEGKVDTKKVKTTINNINKLSDNISRNKNIVSLAAGITSLVKGHSITNNTNLGAISTNINLVSSATLNRVGRITNAIQVKIDFYEKTSTGINIKLRLNEILKQKADFLSLKVGGGKYKLVNNWRSKKYLTLTGGTSFNNNNNNNNNNTFSGIILNKSEIKLSFCKKLRNTSIKCTKEKTIPLINGKYTKADIGNCPKGKNNFNHECLKTEVNGFKLFAYAPYTSNTNLYKKDGTIITSSSTGITFEKGGALISTGSSAGTGTFLAYSGSELGLSSGKDFMIEMRVSKNVFLDNGTKMLFDNNFGSGLILGKQDFKYYINLNNKFICSDFTVSIKRCNLSFTNNFEKVRLINGKKLNIGGKNFILDNTFKIKIDDLFVGSSGYKTSQINGINDYVKIYKN